MAKTKLPTNKPNLGFIDLHIFGMYLDENRFKAFFHSMTIFLKTFKTLPLVFLQFTLNILNNSRHRLFKIKQKLLLSHWHWHHFNSAPWSMLFNNVSYFVTSLQLKVQPNYLSNTFNQCKINKKCIHWEPIKFTSFLGFHT